MLVSFQIKVKKTIFFMSQLYIDVKMQDDPTMVTGGAGFIGSHIVEQLISNDVEVVAIDNLSNGKKENLAPHERKKSFKFIIDDLTRPEKIVDNLSDIKTVYHLAAYPEVRTGFDNPGLSYQDNIYATYLLLESIRKSNVERIVFASSSVVYGEPLIIPTPENYGPLLPISPYGGSKLACEGMISSYCHNYGIRSAIIRLANVVGSKSNHGVIWDFINKLYSNNKKLSILGDGRQTKSYIHIRDCVDGFLFCADSVKNVEVFNLGNDSKIDVDSIAHIVCKNMNLENVKILHAGGTTDGRGWVGDVKQMQLDITKVKKLGWTPKLTSAEAVELASKELINELRYRK